MYVSLPSPPRPKKKTHLELFVRDTLLPACRALRVKDTPPRRRKKRIRYLKLSPKRRSPTNKNRGVITRERGGGAGGSPGPGRLARALSPRRVRSTEYARLPQQQQEEEPP